MTKTAYNLVCEAFVCALQEQSYDMEIVLGMVITYAKQDRMRELTNILCSNAEYNGIQNVLVPTMHQVNREFCEKDTMNC